MKNEKTIMIIIPKKIKKIKLAIAKDGQEKFHILADFDQAVTHSFVNGKLSTSLISILRDGNYLTPDYAKKPSLFLPNIIPLKLTMVSLEKRKK